MFDTKRTKTLKKWTKGHRKLQSSSYASQALLSQPIWFANGTASLLRLRRHNFCVSRIQTFSENNAVLSFFAPK